MQKFASRVAPRFAPKAINNGQMILQPKGMPIPTPGNNFKPGMAISPANNNVFPQYEGERAGLSFEEVQYFNRVEAWKVRGYTLPLSAGVVNEFQIDISGMAWKLFGISFHSITFFDNDPAMPQSVSLIVNEERVIQTQPWTLFEVKYMNYPFYPFERYLSGSDNIILSINNPGAAQNVACSFYYR